MLGVTRFLVRHQAILSIDGLAFPIHSEALGERFCAPALSFAGLEIDGFARELAFGLRRRRRERGLRCSIGPHRLDHRLEDGYCNVAAGRAAAQRAALAVGVVVAGPDRDGDVVGEADEPGVVLLVGGAGLARDIGGKTGDRPGGAPRQHALEHGLELIEGGAVDGLDRHRRFRIVAIDDHAVALDRFHDMRRRSQPFIRDRCVECSKVDRTDRFGAEHERIIPQTFAINLRFQGKITKAIKTGFGFAFYTPVEKVDGCKIARIL